MADNGGGFDLLLDHDAEADIRQLFLYNMKTASFCPKQQFIDVVIQLNVTLLWHGVISIYR